jgi:hypothetical protein
MFLLSFGSPQMIMAALRSEEVFVTDEYFSSPFDPLFPNYRQDIATSLGYSAIPEISSPAFGRETEDQYVSQLSTSQRTETRQSSFDVPLATFFDINPVINDKLSLYDSSGMLCSRVLHPIGVFLVVTGYQSRSNPTISHPITTPFSKPPTQQIRIYRPTTHLSYPGSTTSNIQPLVTTSQGCISPWLSSAACGHLVREVLVVQLKET